MRRWRRGTKLRTSLEYSGDDDFQMGDRPDLKLISKTQLRKNRRALIAAVKKDPDTFMAGILIIGFLMMEKGLPLTSDLAHELRRALMQAENKQAQMREGSNKNQRKRQLSHITNLIDGEYEPSSSGTRVLLYGTKGNKLRGKKRDKRKREEKKRNLRKSKEMTFEDVKAFAYTYLLLRLFNTAKKTNDLFRLYAPDIQTKQLCDYLYNEGLCDDRCRPNQYFKNRIYTLLRDKEVL